jgi:hypothetical protein
VSILNKTFDRGQIYALQGKLSEIPADLNTLFHDMVTRDSQNKVELDMCVRWLLFAIRPMNPKECYFALLSGLELSALTWSKDEIPYEAMEKFILHSSKGLAQITPSRRPRVQFIHESVREFLLEHGGFHQVEPEPVNDFHRRSHQRLANCCLHYMKSAVLLDTTVPMVQRMSESGIKTSLYVTPLKCYPFLEYSVLHILDHATEAQLGGIKMTRTVSHFRSDEHLSSEVNITFVQIDNITNLRDGRLHEQPIHAYFALIVVKGSVIFGIACAIHDNEESVRIFANDDDRASFEADRRVRICRGGNRRFLSYMAECAPVRVMAALLGSGRFDVNLLDPDGMAPLDYALKRGDDAIIDLLYKAGAVKHRRGSLPRFLCTSPAETHELYDRYGNGSVRETHKLNDWYGSGNVRERM